MLAEADLCDDVDALRALVLDQSRRIDALQSAQAEVERLKAIHGINPHQWLTATLSSLAEGHMANRVGELMTWIIVA